MNIVNLEQGTNAWHAHRARKPMERHGYVGTKEYNSYNAMKDRCNNPKNKRFPRYGGRGINVCEAWKNSFIAFITNMGDMPSPECTLERLDNYLGYSPDNCVWATAEEQAKNKSNNHCITIGGKTMTITDWSRETGIQRSVFLSRIKRGINGSNLIKKHCVKKITAFGFTGTFAEWSRRTGIKASTIAQRIRCYRFNHEEAVSRMPT